MSSTSSFFPNAPSAPSAPPPPPPPTVPKAVAANSTALPWQGIRVAASNERITFPAVRSALWDRTARGPAVALTPVTPHLSLLPQLLEQVAHYAASTGGAATLQATISMPQNDPLQKSTMAFLDVSAHSFHEEASAGRRPPPPTSSLDGTQPCAIRLHSAAWPASGELRPQADAYASLLERSLEALEGPRPLLLGEAVPMHCAAACSADCASLLLRVEALVPTLALQALPLYTLAVMRSPLSDSLREAGLRQQLRTGYLTMDQSRKLVVLSEGDPKAFEVPLVGVWAAGVRGATDPLAWAACVRFARLRPTTAETVLAPDDSGAFLMLLYEEWSDDYGGCVGASVVSPQLYEVTPNGTYSPYKLVGRGLQVPLPLPPTASLTPAKCDLFTTESAELAKLLRQLEPMAEMTSAPRVAVAKATARMAKTETPPRANEPSNVEAVPAVGGLEAPAPPAKEVPKLPVQLSAPPKEESAPTAEQPTTGGAMSSATEVALVSMVTQLQAQVAAMGTRMEQQQTTIARLTEELHRAALAEHKAHRPLVGAPPASPPKASLAKTSPSKTSPSRADPKVNSHDAMRSAVMTATKEERLAAYEDVDDEEDDVGDAMMLRVDPEVGAMSTGGRTMVAAFDDMPRIIYEPDDDDEIYGGDEEGDVGELTQAELTQAAMEADDEDLDADEEPIMLAVP